LIEGNSFLRFTDVDFTVLVTGGTDTKIKSSARWAFQKASAVYQFDSTRPGAKTNQTSPCEAVGLLNRKFGPMGLTRSLHSQPTARLGWTPVLPAYAARDLPKLVKRINQIHSLRRDVLKHGPFATSDGSNKHGSFAAADGSDWNVIARRL
jgi:hypothetical protein